MQIFIVSMFRQETIFLNWPWYENRVVIVGTPTLCTRVPAPMKLSLATMRPSLPATYPSHAPKKPFLVMYPCTPPLHPRNPSLHPCTPPLHPWNPSLHPGTPPLHPRNPSLHPCTPPLHPWNPSLHPCTPPLHPRNPSLQPVPILCTHGSLPYNLDSELLQLGGH